MYVHLGTHPHPLAKKKYLNDPIVLPTSKDNSQDQLTGLEFKKSGMRENNLGGKEMGILKGREIEKMI